MPPSNQCIGPQAAANEVTHEHYIIHADSLPKRGTRDAADDLVERQAWRFAGNPPHFRPGSATGSERIMTGDGDPHTFDLANVVSLEETVASGFKPSSTFTQTCGYCGCVFRVEIERQRDRNDTHDYSCPQCHHHKCGANTSTPPRVTLIDAGTKRS